MGQVCGTIKRITIQSFDTQTLKVERQRSLLAELPLILIRVLMDMQTLKIKTCRMKIWTLMGPSPGVQFLTYIVVDTQLQAQKSWGILFFFLDFSRVCI